VDECIRLFVVNKLGDDIRDSLRIDDECSIGFKFVTEGEGDDCCCFGRVLC
jgi:hypothetical protein